MIHLPDFILHSISTLLLPGDSSGPQQLSCSPLAPSLPVRQSSVLAGGSAAEGRTLIAEAGEQRRMRVQAAGLPKAARRLTGRQTGELAHAVVAELTALVGA